MIDSDLKQLLVGKKIKDVEFNCGVSEHSNLVKSIFFSDGTKLSFSVISPCDFVRQFLDEQRPGLWNKIEVFGSLR